MPATRTDAQDVPDVLDVLICAESLILVSPLHLSTTVVRAFDSLFLTLAAHTDTSSH